MRCRHKPRIESPVHLVMRDLAVVVRVEFAKQTVGRPFVAVH